MRELVIGAVGGGMAAGLVWFIANRAIDSQLQRGAAGLEPQVRAAVQAAVPPAVRQEIVMTMARYNITPQTGQMINSTLTLARSAGIIR